MPMLGTRGAASARGFGFGGGVSEKFYLGLYDLNSQSSDVVVGSYCKSIVSDASGNVYQVYRRSSPSGFCIVKMSPSGETLFFKQYEDPAGGSVDSVNILINSAGTNLYVVTKTNTYFYVLKLNSSGALISQYQNGTADMNATAALLASDESAIYIGSRRSGFNGFYVLKYNLSTNQIDWANQWENSSNFGQVQYMSESAGEIYTFGIAGVYSLIQRFSSSGTLIYSRVIGSSNWSPGGMWVGGGVIYLGVVSNNWAYLLRYGVGTTDPVGNIGRQITSGFVDVKNVLVDSAFQNVYWVGGDGSTKSAWIKTDAGISTGAPLVNREFTLTRLGQTKYFYQRDLALTPTGLAMSAQYQDYGLSYLNIGGGPNKVPVDGTKTGSYSVGSFTVNYSAPGSSYNITNIGAQSTSSLGGNNARTLSQPTSYNNWTVTNVSGLSVTSI